MAEYEADRSEAFFTRAGQAREIALDGEAWNAGAGSPSRSWTATDDDG
jgi:hypothetical protein